MSTNPKKRKQGVIREAADGGDGDRRVGTSLKNRIRSLQRLLAKPVRVWAGGGEGRPAWPRQPWHCPGCVTLSPRAGPAQASQERQNPVTAENAGGGGGKACGAQGEEAVDAVPQGAVVCPRPRGLACSCPRVRCTRQVRLISFPSRAAAAWAGEVCGPAEGDTCGEEADTAT